MFRLARHLAAVASLTAFLLAAPSDPWLKITSANFELYTTAGEKSGREMVRHFEEVRSFFVQAFGGRLKDAKPARLIVFRNEKEYQPYKPNEFASAFFHSGMQHDFIVMSSASTEQFPTAVHEYTHLMVHQSGMDLPPWLNEGLAELYSNLEPRDSKIIVGQVIPGRLQVLRSDKWIPLATLVKVDHASPYYNEKARAGMFYAESWALVHMLSLEPQYRPHLDALAVALKDKDPQTAFVDTMGQRIEEIDAALRDYFTAATIHAAVFDVQLPKSIDTPEIETGASLPARLALAELLVNMRGRTEQARAAYEQLAKAYPDRWEVEEGLGEFHWQQRKLQDSAQHFARAMQLGCKNLSTLLLYARVLGYNRQPKEEADVLGKTVELYPESSEANLELGSALVRTSNFGAALAALLAVKKVTTPEQAYQLLYSLAFARYHLNDPERAREDLVKARTYTKNPTELAGLDQLEQALNRPARRIDAGSAPGTPTSEDASPPHLMRRETTATPARELPKLPAVEGKLEEMECGQIARLHVRVGEAIQIFLIPDPTKIVISSGSGEAVSLQCGEQKPARTLHIEYQAVSPASGATGLVRTLEFR